MVKIERKRIEVLIIQTALSSIIFQIVELDGDEKLFLQDALKKVGQENIDDYISDPATKSIENKFLSAVEKIRVLLTNYGCCTSNLFVYRWPNDLRISIDTLIPSY